MAELNSWQKISRVLPAQDFGDGIDGAYTSSTVPTLTKDSCSGSASSNTLTTSSATFSDGDLLLIHQTRGSGAGQWEINRVSSGGGTTSLTLQTTLHYDYSYPAQAIKIPRYTDVNISSGTWSPTDWNGVKGGIFPIACKGDAIFANTLELNGASSSSTIGGIGGGYYGGDNWKYCGEGTAGASYQLNTANGNGGGGGSMPSSGDSGGGGGGNGTAGSNGYTNNPTPGYGGSTSGSADLITIDFGGGGGGAASDDTSAGGGGAGGGILMLFCRTIDTSSATISVNGGNGYYQGQAGGGGGAGGSILIVCQTATLGTNKITASAGAGGGNSSNSGGGAGGVGRISVHHSSTITGTTSPTLNDTTETSLLNGAVNSVKASIVVKDIDNSNSVKGKLYTLYPNYTKAYIPTHQIGNETKAYITATSIRKSYEYRIYDDNTYVTTWASEVISDPSFRTIINGGASQLSVRLARQFDNFGEDVDVKLNNRVDLWCFDRDAINGLRIYRGYISSYKPVLSGNNEIIEITVLNYLAETSGYMLRDESGQTTVEYTSVDPSAIMRHALDRYMAYGGTLTYTATSIEDTGTLVTYTFTSNTIKEVLDKVVELCPDGWYWYVDSSGVVNLHPQPTDTSHRFRIGREVSYAETERRGEDIVNEIYFVGGGTPQMYRYYKNDGSIAAYGRRSYKYIDQRVTVTATADTMSSRMLNAKQGPEIRTKITVNDNSGSSYEKGYNIEAISVGDTFKIGNLKQGVKTMTLWDVGEWDVDIWDQTLAYLAISDIQIQSIDYAPDSVTIEASSRLPDVNKRIEDINRNAETTVLVDNPTSPTDA